MRINQFIAQATGKSRRAADKLIANGQIKINGQAAALGSQVESTDHVTMNGETLVISLASATIMLNKPAGYVCSRNGQGSQTIYDLLPAEYQRLKPVGRLDKYSSGLILLTDDGQLAQKLTHPSFNKVKIYEVRLNKALSPNDRQKIGQGVKLEDGPSKLLLKPLDKQGIKWQIQMTEGRNRQIRRTFGALSYSVNYLHRVQFGNYQLSDLAVGKFEIK